MAQKYSLELVQRELHKVVLADLAEDLELSYGCLWCIREGKTKWPRLSTIKSLLPALGLTLEIREFHDR